MFRSHGEILRGTSFVLTLVAFVLGGSWPSTAHGASFTRGDVDGTGARDISDAVSILNFLFSGGKAPVCVPAADANGDAELNLSDAIFLLAHLFLGGPEPPALTPAEIQTCSGVDPQAIARGLKELETPDPNGNHYACSTCHSLAPEAGAEVLRPGYTLLDSLVRPNFKQGGRATYAGAVNVCREEWMEILDPVTFEYVPWAEDEPRLKDLSAFIASLSTATSSPALVYELVAPKQGPATGNAANGCALFNRSCSVCHNLNGSGAELGPTLLDVTSACTDKTDLCLDFLCNPAPETCLDNPDYLRYRIRLSGPKSPNSPYHLPAGWELAGSAMPFWTPEKMSDAEVEDIVAFILESRSQIRGGGARVDCVVRPGPDGNVVRRGALAGGLHGLAGTVELLDTSRLRFTGFSYDGAGIEVKVYLRKGADWGTSVPVSSDLFGRIFVNETLVVELPGGTDPSAFDTVVLGYKAAQVDLATAGLAAP